LVSLRIFISVAGVRYLPIVGKLDTRSPVDGVGDQVRFGTISTMWNVGSDLYIADGSAIRKLDLQTREVSTLTLRAGTGRQRFGVTPAEPTFIGLADLWSDGTYLYATDIGAGRIRRIRISSGEVEDFSSPGSVSWGLTATPDSFFVANARTREILRVDPIVPHVSANAS
jgi:streptogramin lyase